MPPRPRGPPDRGSPRARRSRIAECPPARRLKLPPESRLDGHPPDRLRRRRDSARRRRLSRRHADGRPRNSSHRRHRGLRRRARGARGAGARAGRSGREHDRARRGSGPHLARGAPARAGCRRPGVRGVRYLVGERADGAATRSRGRGWRLAGLGGLAGAPPDPRRGQHDLPRPGGGRMGPQRPAGLGLRVVPRLPRRGISRDQRGAAGMVERHLAQLRARDAVGARDAGPPGHRRLVRPAVGDGPAPARRPGGADAVPHAAADALAEERRPHRPARAGLAAVRGGAVRGVRRPSQARRCGDTGRRAGGGDENDHAAAGAARPRGRGRDAP